jgi:hypothetical protein
MGKKADYAQGWFTIVTQTHGIKDRIAKQKTSEITKDKWRNIVEK